ncbi:MAG: NAD(P)/FAD-dependent oxidoreductase [Deltaproteobacteria bacterium]|nr:NAD(P)/FAD-dependent oxidoreductase [Deltaproteobacteria bacterium]
MKPEENRIVVIGAGLAGLAAAATLARAGQPVELVEKGTHPGGRAATHEKGGFYFNVGPHALYGAGEAARVLKELGVSYKGAAPSATGLTIREGKTWKLPATPWSLLTTGIIPFAERLRFGNLLRALLSENPEKVAGETTAEWVKRHTVNPVTAELVHMLFRLVTYANAPGHLSAGAAVSQFQLGEKGNVQYLDGGWQPLADSLRETVEKAGGRFRVSAEAASVELDNMDRRRTTGVRLRDDTLIPAEAVILAVPPSAASALVDGGKHPELSRWASNLIPVRAACLDLALRKLPNPDIRFALGVDRPLYYSVHSATAKLAPEGMATVSVAKYLDPHGESRASEDEVELYGLMDLIQPGWREELIHRQFLPRPVVTWALPEAATAGISGRPGLAVPGVQGLYVVGDWAGKKGQLADAALASGQQAARELIQARRQMEQQAA